MKNKNVIYIRHGSDKKGDYKYDEKLTSEGKKGAVELSKKLIALYGIPDIIYYSPFYRTRQTRKAMIHAIKEYNREIGENKMPELVLEPRLGRFFTKKQRRDPNIRSSTMHKGAIIDERWDEFKERVKEQYDEVMNNKHALIWNITHTLVLLQVSNLSNIERNPHVEYLDYCIVNKN